MVLKVYRPPLDEVTGNSFVVHAVGRGAMSFSGLCSPAKALNVPSLLGTDGESTPVYCRGLPTTSFLCSN